MAWVFFSTTVPRLGCFYYLMLDTPSKGPAMLNVTVTTVRRHRLLTGNSETLWLRLWSGSEVRNDRHRMQILKVTIS